MSFEEADFQGGTGELGEEVAFEAATHAFEDEEIGIGGLADTVIAELGQVDEGFVGAGVDYLEPIDGDKFGEASIEGG